MYHNVYEHDPKASPWVSSQGWPNRAAADAASQAVLARRVGVVRVRMKK